MSPSKVRRSPRASRASLAGPASAATPLSARLRGENAPIQPSPLRNEIASSAKAKSRKRARSLGGAGDGDTVDASSAKLANPRKKRMTVVHIPFMGGGLTVRLLRGGF